MTLDYGNGSRRPNGWVQRQLDVALAREAIREATWKIPNSELKRIAPLVVELIEREVGRA